MSDNKLGAILCPNCGKLISANSETCMHCGAKNPNLWGAGDILRKFFSQQNSLIPAIFSSCIALFGLALLLDPKNISGLLAPSFSVLRSLGMTGIVPVATGKWWTVVTAVYLHGNLMHIAFNMMAVRQLGAAVEELYGVSRTFIIYTFAGILGFVASVYLGTGYTLGASGAIFGLLGALVYYGKKRGGVFGQSIYRQSLQWAIVLFIFGFLFPGIDNFAHAGGLAGGYLSASVVGFIEIKRENRTHLIMAGLSVLITVGAFLLNFLN